MRWKQRGNRSNLSSTGVPGYTVKPLKSNHSTSASRTVEDQVHLQLQQTECQDGNKSAVQREVRVTSTKEEAGFLDD